jgi:transmembrane sensor
MQLVLGKAHLSTVLHLRGYLSYFQDMDQEKLAELIRRYKSGSATPEEIATLEELWRKASKDSSFEAEHSAGELEDIERKTFKAINLEILKHKRDRTTPLLSRPLFYKVAATVLILFSVSLWWYANSNDPIEIRNGFGERLTVTLPDQSTVVLNGNSVLRYSNDWDKVASREVWIEGEAFFSVIHTKDHQKFIVHADNQLRVEVLGTKFNVKARHQTSEVMLAEGRVKIGLGKNVAAEEVFMEPGELAIVRNKSISKQVVKQQKYISWVENKLFFDRTPLSELAVLLRDTYGLTVTFANPGLEKRELSGEISSATADDIFYAIAETLDLKIEREGKSAVISLKRD